METSGSQRQPEVTACPLMRAVRAKTSLNSSRLAVKLNLNRLRLHFGWGRSKSLLGGIFAVEGSLSEEKLLWRDGAKVTVCGVFGIVSVSAFISVFAAQSNAFESANGGAHDGPLPRDGALRWH